MSETMNSVYISSTEYRKLITNNTIFDKAVRLASESIYRKIKKYIRFCEYKLTDISLKDLEDFSNLLFNNEEKIIKITDCFYFENDKYHFEFEEFVNYLMDDTFHILDISLIRNYIFGAMKGYISNYIKQSKKDMPKEETK